jgi:amino acid transporter
LWASCGSGLHAGERRHRERARELDRRALSRVTGRAWHNGLLVALFGGLAIANIRGVKTGAYLVEGLTVLKLALLLLIVVGVRDQPANLAWSGVPSAT